MEPSSSLHNDTDFIEVNIDALLNLPNPNVSSNQSSVPINDDNDTPAPTLMYELAVIRSRIPQGMKFWIVENDKCCLDFIRTQLKVSSLSHRTDLY